jgi:hypothetical protein
MGGICTSQISIMSTAATTVVYSAIAAYEEKGQLKPFQYTPFPLRPNDVEIAISCCGVWLVVPFNHPTFQLLCLLAAAFH